MHLIDSTQIMKKNQKPKIQTPKHLNVEKDYCQESI